MSRDGASAAHRIPRTTRVGTARAGADLHALALALDAPALVERGDAPRESWHVIPLAPWARAEVAAGSADSGLHALHELWTRARTDPPAEDVPFAGGLVVLLGYGLGREIERLPQPRERRDRIPRMHAVACSASLLLPVGGGEAVFAWTPSERGRGGLDEAAAAGWSLRCEAALRDEAAGLRAEPPGRPIGAPQAAWSRGEHVAAVRSILEELKAGEIYQANLTQRFEVPWEGSALPLHRVLRRQNPSPFSGFLRASDGSWEVVSGSPERLVRKQGAELCTEPIAGTIPLPQGPDTPDAEIARLAARLAGSAKDHAEHVMIVDLHRNDLGRVSVPGSVRVEEMMRLDRRSHVLQAIADIRGVALPGAGPVEIIRALFPAGCITGVPKIRAMEILNALEPFARGPYTGSFGIVSGWGDLDLNVLIRSAWRSGSTLAFAAGGGIVLDSDPEAEYEESLAKAAALHRAVETLAAEGA